MTKKIKEMFHITYFDKEELSLKEHADKYLAMRKDILEVLRKYDVEFVLAETEILKDLAKENRNKDRRIRELEELLTIKERRDEE